MPDSKVANLSDTAGTVISSSTVNGTAPLIPVVAQPPSKPLHILLVSCTWGAINGADRDWISLANALGPEQIRLTWAGIEGSEYLRSHLDERILSDIYDYQFNGFNYLLHQNAYQRRPATQWAKIIADYMWRLREPVRRLEEALRDNPVDIVVTNTTTIMVGAAYALKHRLPHVWCVKEYLDPRLLASRRLARLVSRLSSAVIVPSRAMAKAFPNRVHVFHDGSEVDRIRNSSGRRSREEVLESLGLPTERPVVAQVGWIGDMKGQHVTIAAYERLATHGGLPPFSLIFLGHASPSPYQERLDSTLQRTPQEWRDAVRFVQFEPDDYSYMAAADIIAHPSALPDPFPNAVREAMILGKPVVGSRIGGIPEMIRHGETGLLFEPENSGAMAEALSHLIASEAVRTQMGASAQQYALEQFDIHVRKQDFFRLFCRLAEQRH